jgi:hypothetical protein
MTFYGRTGGQKILKLGNLPDKILMAKKKFSQITGTERTWNDFSWEYQPISLKGKGYSKDELMKQVLDCCIRKVVPHLVGLLPIAASSLVVVIDLKSNYWEYSLS